MEFLLFDRNAIETIICDNTFQSVEYAQGSEFIRHVCNEAQSETLGDVLMEHTPNGVFFVGRKKENSKGKEVFCIDLTQCNIMSEKSNKCDLMTVLQKAFRTAIRFWDHQPFTNSERIHGSKSIIFPFAISDRRRIVIERSNNCTRLEKRGIKYPLLAYKYNAEDAPQGEEVADIRVLERCGEQYLSEYVAFQNRFGVANSSCAVLTPNAPLTQISAASSVEGAGFIFFPYDQQLSLLTESQRSVVESANIDSPIRIEGPAGTGKTASLIMRAYYLLCQHKVASTPFRVVFFAHSESTNRRNAETFSYYAESEFFLCGKNVQCIRFVTLLDYCREFAEIDISKMVEKDAMDAKTFQYMLIESVVSNAIEQKMIRTYKPLLSTALCSAFDDSVTPKNALYAMLQHEFSIQIKGRTNCTIDKYYELLPLENGLPTYGKRDKELIFELFSAYQAGLRTTNSFDVDDIILEALSRFNAPIWRRERSTQGFDYIFVDEMHLFNINEQSVFHYLTKKLEQKEIPICFALDYGQAIGDRGKTSADYIESAFGDATECMNYGTIFRNSPQITDFCASIAASGTLMFQNAFANPYVAARSNFTDQEEKLSEIPSLHMYSNNDEMLSSINGHINNIIKDLQCKPSEIALISFDERLTSNEGIAKLTMLTEKQFVLLDNNTFEPKRSNGKKDNSFVLASPYAVNGLEFKAVILIGADEGRIPQTIGVSDVSQHFIRYSAYNLLYLASSRAKYRLILLGHTLNGISSCLIHSIESKYLEVK